VHVTNKPRFVFLVSDSRSGSTLLARELSARVADIVVTTELNFDRVFAARWMRFRSPRRIARQVAAQPNFKPATEADDAQAWARSLKRGQECSARLFEGLMDEWLASRRRDVRLNCVVVKNGSHARHAAEIHATLRQRVRFIFLVRDPRAVVASKLRTPRPYAPWEVMAWGGSLIAALRWRSYARNMARAKSLGAEVLEVRYEELTKDPIGVIDAIARHCGCAVRQTALPANTYQVPAPEKHIHAMAMAEEISTRPRSEWTSTLSARDRRIVEAMCDTEMRRRGYTPTSDGHMIKRALICACAVPQSAWLILTHVINCVRKHPRNGHDSIGAQSDQRGP